MPVAALISTDPTNGPHTAGVPFKFDASPKIGAFSSTIIHYFTTLNSLTSRDCATFQTNRICSVEAQAVCSARGDANSHGNDEWENDYEVRIVKSQYTSPPRRTAPKVPGRQFAASPWEATHESQTLRAVRPTNRQTRHRDQAELPTRDTKALSTGVGEKISRLCLTTCPPVPFVYSVGVSFSFALLTPTRRTIGESTVSAQTEMLGGRLPLLEPSALSAAQKETYERLNRTWIPWANDVPFQSKLEDGRLIGPFNPILFCPAISSSFLDLQETEQKNTSLSQRVRQVVILAVGAVWKSNYELYAHAAAARKAGISEEAIQMLTTGGLPDELDDREKIAQRYARQLSAERHVDAALYSAAERAFGQRGLVEITYLTGIYHTVCALLNAFEIPAPGS